MKAGDFIAIIHAPGQTLAKTIYGDGRTTDYGNAWRFNLFEMRVANLDSLRDLLTALMTRA